MSLQVKLLPVSDFQQNCRILFNSGTKNAVVIDPGGDAQSIIDELKKYELNLEGVYLTHSHIDHCGGVAPLLETLAAPLYGHVSEQQFRQNVLTVAQMYGLSPKHYFNCPEPQIYLEEGMNIEILGKEAKIIATPGHSPGSLSFWLPSESLVLSGDVLFLDSIGRTDLPGGDYDTLLASIEKLMKQLPTETRVLSGHGPDTTLGREKDKNPFLK